jgi:toxin ParE1/3/4
MKVRWTEQALARLSDLYQYIANDNPDAASRLIDSLIERGDRLSRFPKRGRAVPELGNPEIRELIVRGYRLVYRVGTDCVDILTVFEGHHRLPENEIDRK